MASERKAVKYHDRLVAALKQTRFHLCGDNMWPTCTECGAEAVMIAAVPPKTTYPCKPDCSIRALLAEIEAEKP